MLMAEGVLKPTTAPPINKPKILWETGRACGNSAGRAYNATVPPAVITAMMHRLISIRRPRLWRRAPVGPPKESADQKVSTPNWMERLTSCNVDGARRSTHRHIGNETRMVRGARTDVMAVAIALALAPTQNFPRHPPD